MKLLPFHLNFYSHYSFVLACVSPLLSATRNAFKKKDKSAKYMGKDELLVGPLEDENNSITASTVASTLFSTKPGDQM